MPPGVPMTTLNLLLACLAIAGGGHGKEGSPPPPFPEEVNTASAPFPNFESGPVKTLLVHPDGLSLKLYSLA